MALIITNRYDSRAPGHILHIASDGAPGLVAYLSGLELIARAAMLLRKAQRQAALYQSSRYSFEDELVARMKAEARNTARRAVWAALAAGIVLRAGFVAGAMATADQPTADQIRSDLLELALRHLRAAEAAMAAGLSHCARRHLANFYLLTETTR